ncbi:MAG: sigma-70 family RNA polymerase sigma factor [Dysgonamonadaceae bacterium]|nr:sigma-70 family RNA polymerase sigma factor [Dysgonamonadaceae bacterium]
MRITQFKTIIIPLKQKLLAFALKMMEDDAEAEDIVQEAFLKLWQMHDELDKLQNPEGFAMQMTKNICIDRIRTRKIQVAVDDFHLGVNAQTPDSVVELKDSVNVVRQIIRQLPKLQKIIIQMRDVEGYELSEIAEITGTQVDAVRTNLSRARKKVRETYMKINGYQM